MKKFFGFYALLSLFAFLISSLDAAVVKRPMTAKSYGDMYYMEWTGSAPVVTADELDLMADTTAANVYGMDPFYMLMANNKSATTGPWHSYPGIHFPEKLCIEVTEAGDADATTSDVYVLQAATKSATHRKVTLASAAASTVTSVATTTTRDIAAVPVNPFQFFKIVIDPTTATDSIEVVAVRAWSCDD